MLHLELSDKALKHRRAILLSASVLLALVYFDITVQNVATLGIEISGLTQEALHTGLMAYMLYQSFAFGLVVMFEFSIIGVERTAELATKNPNGSSTSGQRGKTENETTTSPDKPVAEEEDSVKELKKLTKEFKTQLRIVQAIKRFPFEIAFPLIMAAIASLASIYWLEQRPPDLSLHATDGDTIRAGDERIRIIGIDAPELGRRARCVAEQKAAEKARDFLSTALASGPVTITRQGEDRYGRTLAYVFVNGRDIADTMIDLDLGRPYMGGRRDGWCETAPSANN
ncbi:MAG: thermonuclease family protein [Parvibaculaceae bacterium]|nr:thermonuclease family protein [Parvibaculaceae bacterium]